MDLELARTFTSNGKTIISQHIGGLWQWLVLAVFLVAMGLAISPIGSVKLGEPEPNQPFVFLIGAQS